MTDAIKNQDYKNGAGSYDLAMYDPPFDIWHTIDHIVDAKTFCCFTNFQNRHHVERLFGVPKFELIWYFKDGRWVSHNMPRLTHEHILIYGDLKNHAYTGERTVDHTPIKKGKGSIGRDTNLGKRTYKPKERKLLNSVIEVPRNVGKELGVWGKPINLIKPLLEWLTLPDDRVFDGFAGSGTFGVVAHQLHLHYEGFEINSETARIANQRINAVRSQTSLFS